MKIYETIKKCLMAAALTVLAVLAILASQEVFADNPHHLIPDPVVNITEVYEVTNVTTYAAPASVAYDDSELGSAISMSAALSGLQTINLTNGGTGGSMSISKYNDYAGAFSLQHRYNDVSYGLNYGFSGGEDALSISVGGQFR